MNYQNWSIKLILCFLVTKHFQISRLNSVKQLAYQLARLFGRFVLARLTPVFCEKLEDSYWLYIDRNNKIPQTWAIGLYNLFWSGKDLVPRKRRVFPDQYN